MMKLKAEKRNLLSLIFSGIALLFCVVLLIMKTFSLSWFSNNSSVSATGLSVSLQGNSAIYTTQGESFATEANDISVLEFAEIIPETTVNNPSSPAAVSTVAPGSYGTITFNITCTEANNIHAEFKIYKLSNGNPEALPDTDNCNEYVSTHIALFTEKVGDTYSGWISPDAGLDIALDNDGHASVTLYWRWLETYNFASGISEISDHMDARDHMDACVNYSKWFYYGTEPETVTQFIDAYNSADTVIGTVLNANDICFGIEFSAS